MEFKTAQKLKEALHQALQKMGTFESCALVEYPAGSNIGSHLLWVSSILYLKDIVKAKAIYTCGLDTFSETEMKKIIGNGPIIIRGGLIGDFWYPGGKRRQEFFKGLVSKYTDHPIVIMPQSFHFSNPHELADSGCSPVSFRRGIFRNPGFLPV